MIQIAVMGYGTVGSDVVEVLSTNQASIDKRVGEEVRVKYVLDLRDFPGDPVESVLVHDFETIVNDPEVKVVVEVMGGVEPAYTFTKRCLLAGKSVCTSNKALVAAHGAELLQIAKDKNLNYLFEASVGGGIPIIRPLQTCLTADEIVEISGILNGTTNYILTNMTYGGASFDDALKDAQDKGYAERNPEADVEGHDACRKIAIPVSYTHLEGDFLFGMITNSKSVGGFKSIIGKNVIFDDGVFEMTFIMRPKNPMELQEILAADVYKRQAQAYQIPERCKIFL